VEITGKVVGRPQPRFLCEVWSANSHYSL
jgi:hypothetical protein